MKQEAWNPHPGSMSASAWIIRKVKLADFTPNEDFARRIACHPVECWLDDDGGLFIATPVSLDSAERLDLIEERIESLESAINAALAEQRLLNLIRKEAPQERTDVVEY